MVLKNSLYLDKGQIYTKLGINKKGNVVKGHRSYKPANGYKRIKIAAANISSTDLSDKLEITLDDPIKI